MNRPHTASPSGLQQQLQQQQPQRYSDRHQQQSSGSGEFQPRGPRATQQGASDKEHKTQQIGEGSYEGTRDYQQGIKSYLKKSDVATDARAAKPGTPKEEAELERAEKEGLSHSKAPGQ